MTRRTTLALGAAAGGLLASALLPAAVALADTGAAGDAAAAAASTGFPTTPGADAFTLGGFTYDPFLNNSTGVAAPITEGFNPLEQGTGTSPFFDTGSTGLQSFEVFSPASGTTAAAELGTVQTTENVTSFGSITNTGFDIYSEEPVSGGSLSTLPALGSNYDVTNFGGGYENLYSDVPGASGSAGTVTDTLVTPFGNEDLSSLVSAFSLSSLNPAAGLGVNPDFVTGPEVAGTPGAEAFTLGSTTFDPYVGDPVTTSPTTEGFNLLNQGTGTPGYFETGSGTQNFEVFTTASGSTTPTEVGSIGTTENVTNLFGVTNTGFDVTSGVTSGSATGLPTDGTIYDVTNFGNGIENIYTDVPGAAGAAGTVTDSFVTPFGDYNLSDLVSAFDLSALDPGSAFGLGADAAGATADAVSGVDPLSFLGL